MGGAKRHPSIAATTLIDFARAQSALSAARSCNDLALAFRLRLNVTAASTLWGPLIIPGFIIALLTFPGVILHEWAHKIVCELLRVKVYETVYFNFNFQLIGGEAGFVKHAIPKQYVETLLISSAPLFINSVAAIACGIIAGATQGHGIVSAFFLWLGFSIGMHAFPSNQDMNNVRQHARQQSLFVGVFSHTLYYTMATLNLLRFLWIDFLYAFLLLALVIKL